MPTYSIMRELGSKVPSFRLPDVVTGEMISLETFAPRKAFLVMFICCHCPYVVHVKHEISRLARDYADKDLGIVAISANDPGQYPADAPDRLKEMVDNWGLTFPVCYDETQETAKAFGAACTPEFFLFDHTRVLVYRGQLDESSPKNDVPTDGRVLRSALDAVLADRQVSQDQMPSRGCNIKWRPGNEPDYFSAP